LRSCIGCKRLYPGIASVAPGAETHSVFRHKFSERPFLQAPRDDSMHFDRATRIFLTYPIQSRNILLADGAVNGEKNNHRHIRINRKTVGKTLAARQACQRHRCDEKKTCFHFAKLTNSTSTRSSVNLTRSPLRIRVSVLFCDEATLKTSSNCTGDCFDEAHFFHILDDH